MIHTKALIFPEFFLTRIQRIPYWRCFFFGLLLPLSFAPFHLPGLAILGLALFYHYLITQENEQPFFSGLVFGLGFFSFGISWVYISIHEYGHLNSLVSALITFIFILYLSLFPALTAAIYCRLTIKHRPLLSGLLFSALWIITEYCRATFLSGFPWLLIGFGQFDAPTKFLLPIIGVYGVGFITCYAATLLSNVMTELGIKRYFYLIALIIMMLLPLSLKNIHWSEQNDKAISIGIIQANMSMRDKWDEALFWQLLQRYQNDATSLLGTKLIVLPESAIPLPATYISDFLGSLQHAANVAGSAILLGIPQPTTMNENYYFNALISLGKAKGIYLKQHLVPFGEYIPKPFRIASNWLGVPAANLMPGLKNQPLVRVHKHPIASLICYELAYGNLLRLQLPLAEWIVSISDDGWFGHSLALYQQLQMAQVRSLQTARYQVVANNDGLSSVIDIQGKIIASLAAYTPGILQASLFPSTGTTPWILIGDLPILFFSALILLFWIVFMVLNKKDPKQAIAAKEKRRYPYEPH